MKLFCCLVPPLLTPYQSPSQQPISPHHHLLDRPGLFSGRRLKLSTSQRFKCPPRRTWDFLANLSCLTSSPRSSSVGSSFCCWRERFRVRYRSEFRLGGAHRHLHKLLARIDQEGPSRPNRPADQPFMCPFSFLVFFSFSDEFHGCVYRYAAFQHSSVLPFSTRLGFCTVNRTQSYNPQRDALSIREPKRIDNDVDHLFHCIIVS